MNSKYFVNEYSRTLILRRIDERRQDFTVRITNFSDSSISALIGLGDSSLAVDRSSTIRPIVPLASIDVVIGRGFCEDGDELLTEEYLFLDYVNPKDPAEIGDGLMFEIMQYESQNHPTGESFFDFCKDHVSGLF